jgi:hypothetical protein
MPPSTTMASSVIDLLKSKPLGSTPPTCIAYATPTSPPASAPTA